MQRHIIISLLFIIACNNNQQNNNIKKETATTVKPVSNKNKIYLTFDYGPTLGNNKLYDYVNEKNCP